MSGPTNAGGRRARAGDRPPRRHSRPAAVALGVFFALSLAVLGGLCPVAAASAPNPVQVVQSSAGGVLLEVKAPLPSISREPGQGLSSVYVDDWRSDFPPGAPDLPVKVVQLALPPGTRPVLSVRVLATTLLPGVLPRPVPHDVIHSQGDAPPLQSLSWERDPASYANLWPAEWARLDAPQYLRFLRVLPVEICPYRWNPRTGGIEVATQMEIDVRFQPISAPLVGKLFQRSRLRPIADEAWSRVYQHAVLNPEIVTSSLRAPAPGASADPATGLPTAPVRVAREGRSGGLRGFTAAPSFALSPSAANPEVEITVDHNDLYRVTFASLQNQGWQPVAPDKISLVERTYFEADSSAPYNPFRERGVPIIVRDLNNNGVFDSGDDILFFGLTTWDSLHPGPSDRRYGRNNSYFINATDFGGARMASGGASTLGDTLQAETSFVWTQHLEGDGVYMKSFAQGDSGSFVAGAAGIKTDHFLWFGGEPTSPGSPDAVKFNLPGLVAAESLVVALQGITNPPSPYSGTPARPVLMIKVGSNGVPDTLPNPIQVPVKSQAYYSLGASGLASFPLAASNDYLAMGEPEDGYGAAVNWMEWTWRRNFAAGPAPSGKGVELQWTAAGLTGPREFDVTGFGAQDLPLLFDLSDSLVPRTFTVDPSQMSGGVLKVQFDYGQAQPPRILLALNAAAAATPLRVAVTATDNLKDGRPAAMIVVVNPQFAQGIQPLVTARIKQLGSVRTVLTTTVFDQFNGGRAWPTAIRNYLRYLFRTLADPPSYLLLVGDASVDFAGVTEFHGTNYCPTQTIYSSAYSDQGYELVACDEWFVDNLTGEGETLDCLPDMHVGRLPVGSQDELTNTVTKILDYGNYQDTDTWRRRGLFLSDDCFSSTINFTENYAYQSAYAYPPRPPFSQQTENEAIFRWSSWKARKIIQDAGFTDLEPDTFMTAQFMDTVACLGRCQNVIKRDPNDCTTWRCRLDTNGQPDTFNIAALNYGGGGPQDNLLYGANVVSKVLLHKYLDQGYLFVDYDGHANRGLLTHEYIYEDDINRQDTPNLENAGRPFIFMGYGCHLAEFAREDEANSPTNDAMTEKLLYDGNDAGAIACYASSAYEWLPDNDIANTALMECWFSDPPRDPITNQTRWILGEIITASKDYLTTNNGPTGAGQALTYTLLGDPSMPITTGPPHLDITVNGQSWDPTQRVEAESGTDLLHLQAHLHSTIHLGDVTVLNGGAVVDTSAYQLRDDPVRVGDDRFKILTYDPKVVLSDAERDIEIEAKDGSGLQQTVILPLKLDTRFQVLRQGVPTDFQPNTVIETGDTIAVAVQSPVALTANAFSARLDGEPLGSIRSGSTDAWTWTARIPLPAVPSGTSHTVQLGVSAGDSVITRSATFTGPGTGPTAFLHVYNFPNPFGRDTWFCYELNKSGVSVKVSVFTIAGRRIWSYERPSAPAEGTLAIHWDGRDQDGDQVANGLYFYKLEVRTAEGTTIKRVDRLARVR